MEYTPPPWGVHPLGGPIGTHWDVLGLSKSCGISGGCHMGAVLESRAVSEGPFEIVFCPFSGIGSRSGENIKI